ncbi:MAG: sugar phosphate isomerase/epimerase [Luteitalea sp.]|nr:sugar phosphate isomerase/epimerase [Luteitalea sp.]
MLSQDFVGTITQLADIGFESIELCSPVGYEDFKGIAKYSGTELRKIFGDLGVTCVSAHFSMKELREDLPGRIAWAKDVGLTQMMVPTLAGPENPTMDDVKRVADEYNEMAAQSAQAGLLQGVHNEGFELSMVEGRRTYDVLLELLDPKLVTFQFQISTISRGYDSIEYFTKYPGRFGSMHVQGWSAKTKERMAVGEGTLDWKKIFTAAKTGGVKNYFVEMNLDLMKASMPYLRELEV